MSSDTLETVAPSAVIAHADTPAKPSRQRTAEGHLIPVPAKLPAALRQQLRALAEQRGVTVSAVVRTTLESALRSGVATEPNYVADAARSRSGRATWSRRVTLRLALEDLRRAEAYAARAGLRKASALAEIVHLGLEAADAREGVPGARADAILDVLHAQQTLVSHLGPALFATLILVAFSVARGSSGKIAEDELLAQARLAGDDEWTRILDELG